MSRRRKKTGSQNISPVSSEGRLNLPGVRPELWEELYGYSAYATPATVLGIPTFWRCINILANLTAVLPCKVYFQNGKSRERLRGHPVEQIFNRTPDGGDTNAEVQRRAWAVQKHLYGNCLMELIRNGRQEVVQLRSIEHPNYNMYRDEYRKKWYQVTTSDPGKLSDPLPPSKIFHLAGFTSNGFEGKSAITVQRELFERSMLTSSNKTDFWRKGGRPSGTLNSKKRLNADVKAEMREEWNASLPNGTAILTEETTYQPISIPPEDVKFLEGIRWDARLICQIMGVPPYMVGIYEGSTEINAEELALHFLVNTLIPEIRAIEAEAELKLFSDSRYTLELDLYYLLRASYKTQAEFLTRMVSVAGFLPDEVRRTLGHDPLPNGLGQVPLIGGNNFVRLEDVLAGRTFGTPGRPPTDPSSPPTEPPSSSHVFVEPKSPISSSPEFLSVISKMSPETKTALACLLETSRGKTEAEIESSLAESLSE